MVDFLASDLFGKILLVAMAILFVVFYFVFIKPNKK